MFGRGQILLGGVGLCALLLGASTNVARAQCCCHGGGGGDPRAAMMLLQQQLLVQQQLLQHVQQRQLQTAVLEKQVRELAGKGPEAIKAALRDPQAETRWVAALVAGEYGPALTDELIAVLTDENPYVRQAARQGLVRLSTRVEGKPTAGRAVDFGPSPGAARPAQQAAARKWRTWFERRQARTAELKAVTTASADPATTTTRSPLKK